MGKCVVKTCSSRSQIHNKKNGITFHAVPRDPDRREKWVKIIRLLRKETDWLPTKNSHICSNHFRDEDKISAKTDQKYLRLARNAVPILEDERGGPLSLPEELGVIDDEEIEEITESYKEHVMRKTLKRLQLISSNRLKTIKKLAQRNRRLQKRNKRLKESLVALRRKCLLYERLYPGGRLEGDDDSIQITPIVPYTVDIQLDKQKRSQCDA